VSVRLEEPRTGCLRPLSGRTQSGAGPLAVKRSRTAARSGAFARGPARGTLACPITLSLQIGDRGLGFQRRRPDLKDEPERSQTFRAIRLVPLHGFDAER